MSKTLVELTESVRQMREKRTATGEDLSGDWTVLKMAEELGEITTAYLRVKSGDPAACDQLAGDLADMLAFMLDLADRHSLDIDAAILRKWR